jgi:hypothetical protein
MRRGCGIVVGIMSKVVTAQYDAAKNVLRLVEPLEGVADGALVEATVQTPTQVANPSILEFRGILSGENGEEFAALIDEMFPIEK